MSWDFHVRHYGSEARQARDPKYRAGAGVLYPRAATLGGCTAHNAMIYMPPHESDWNHIAALTGDGSWRAAAHAPPCPARRGLPPRAGVASAAPARHRPDRARLGRLAAHREVDPARRPRRRRAACRWSAARRAPSSAAWRRRWRARCAGCAAAATRTRGRSAAAASKASATRRCRRAAIAAPARASACSRSPRRTATASTSSSTRSRPASSSTTTGTARGVAYRKGERLYRAHAHASADAGRGARSACAARGDPLRRRLQHAAAADALGHRPGGAPARARHRRARRPARRRAATCRTATKSR